MYQVLDRMRRLPEMLAASALVAGSLLVVAPSSVFAVTPGTCPLPGVTERGSTTVYPALQAANSALNTYLNCTVSITGSGSGDGETTVNSGAADIGAMSTLPSTNTVYYWPVGADAMVIAGNRAFLQGVSNPQITEAQVKGIWEGTITSWSSIDASLSGTIVPRGRDGATSGSYKDFWQKFGITQSTMDSVITATGLPLLQTSQAEATAACDNSNQIVYTSLANLQAFGPSGQNCLKAFALSADGSAGSFVMPSPTSVSNGTYPVPRSLYLIMKKWSGMGTALTDSTSEVKAQDMLNYMTSSAGQTFVAQVNFVPAAVPATPPIPDYDVTLDGNVNILDIGNLLGRWGVTAGPSCKGWIRADINNDGKVDILDIAQVLSHWGQHPVVHPVGQ